MSTEICAICKDESTPWAYLEILDAHICSACFEYLATLLNKERIMYDTYADIIENKLKKRKEVLRLVENEIKNFKIKDEGMKILTILVSNLERLMSNFERLNIECYLLEEIIKEANREGTTRKESDNDKEVQGNKGNQG